MIIATFFYDIIIYSKDEEEHKRHLEIVFEELGNYKLRDINGKKSEFCMC